MNTLMIRFIWTLIATAGLCAAADAQTYFPPTSGDDWDTVSTAELGWQPDSLTNLRNYLDDQNTKAFIILKDGKIAVEWYFGTFTADSSWYWASAGKTVTAFLIGMAQQEGYLSIDTPTSRYLGRGWTSLSDEREDSITLRHQLSMTTGLNEFSGNPDCTDPECLTYLAPVGTRWAYHNAPYTLLGAVIDSATGFSRNQYTVRKLTQSIGMTGLWLKVGDYNGVFFSNARNMARFGLLIESNGIWDDDTLMTDTAYFRNMITPSQDINESYGYLWWLNGYDSHMQPLLRRTFDAELVPNAPDDMFAGMGKDDQRVYVVPSEDMVVIRLGNAANSENALAISSFDDSLWSKISTLSGPVSISETDLPADIAVFPNPTHSLLTVRTDRNVRRLTLRDLTGRTVASASETDRLDLTALPAGSYALTIQTADGRISTAHIVKR